MSNASPSTDLPSQVAIITGAGSGMGLAMTHRFAREGLEVIAACLHPEQVAALVGIKRVQPIQADVTRVADVDRVIQAASARGTLGVVVNNAGILDRFLPVGEVTDDVWETVMAVNLTGPMYLSRAAIPHFLAAGSGVIINIASVGGLAGGRAGAAYTASKHGLIGLTRNIAATYGPQGIRCVAIAPGGVNTGIPLGGEPSQRGYETLQRTLPANIRMGEPDEIASVAYFLASKEASFMNGAVVVADGGWLAA